MDGLLGVRSWRLIVLESAVQFFLHDHEHYQIQNQRHRFLRCRRQQRQNQQGNLPRAEPSIPIAKQKKRFTTLDHFKKLNACLIKSHHDLLVFTFGTFKERSIADTAASAAPAGLPPWPLVVGDPPVTAEVDICWGDTAAEEAPGGKEPTAFVLRTGCFCRLAWYEKNSALLMFFLINQHISNAKLIKIFWCNHIINKFTYSIL